MKSALDSFFTSNVSWIKLAFTIWHYNVLQLVLFAMSCLPSTVPAGSLAKAASVGANTVSGPLPERVSTSPHAVTAAAMSEKWNR